MASVQSYEKFFAENKVTTYIHNPADATVATDVAWVDMRDYAGFAAIITFAINGGSGGAVAFKILANSDSAGGGTDAEVKVHALGTAVDAIGDQAVLECSAEEIRQLQTTATGDLRYASVNLDCTHADDQFAVTYIRYAPRFPQSGLTADIIA
jgi:hypothetical protein